MLFVAMVLLDGELRKTANLIPTLAYLRVTLKSLRY